MAAAKIDMAQYLHERYLERNTPERDPGPVITISREMGCPGKKVAQLLEDVLNKHDLNLGKKEEWKWIGKEIFISAATDIGLDANTLKDIYNNPRSVIDQIISAQANKYYVNDRRARKIIGQVIRSMANDGHVIILGRGGVALTRDIPKSLHVFLEAPINWRASVVSEKRNIDIPEALKCIKNIDEQRAKYRAYYHGKGTDYTWFDVRFNCMTLSVAEIVDSIKRIMEIRKLI